MDAGELKRLVDLIGLVGRLTSGSGPFTVEALRKANGSRRIPLAVHTAAVDQRGHEPLARQDRRSAPTCRHDVSAT